MKYFYVFLVAIIFSCNHSEPKTELTEKGKSEKERQALSKILTEFGLCSQTEKIILLSAIKGIHHDTLYSILREYDSLNNYHFEDRILGGKSGKTYKNALTYIAGKHNMSVSKIASLIYSIQYEMITRDEINEANQKENEEQAYDQASANEY